MQCLSVLDGLLPTLLLCNGHASALYAIYAWPNEQSCLLAYSTEPTDDEDLSVGQEELEHAQQVQREVSDALREALRGGNIILIPTMPGGPIPRT